MEPDFEALPSKLLYISNLKGMKNSNFSLKGSTTFKTSEMKLWLLLITNVVKISVFAMSHVKLRLKEDNVLCKFFALSNERI